MLVRFLFVLLFLLLTSGCVMFNKVDLSDLFDQKIKFTAIGGEKEGERHIVVIPLHGVILGSAQPFSFSSSVTPSAVEKVLIQLRGNKDLAAVVIEINSPGGQAAASEEVLSRLNKFKAETGVPIVAHFTDFAASGGYYIAQAADVIVSNPNSVTGSIGVVVMFPRIDDFLKNKLEIEMMTFKSGEFKDSGSAFRKMTRKERAHWQQLTMMYYDRFVDVVAEGRKISAEKIREISQGQVMHPQFALKNKLVDKIGTLDDAIVVARELAAKRIDKKSIQIFRISAHHPQPLVPSSIKVNTSLDGFLTTAGGSPGMSTRGAVWYIH